uniref:Uncharacterized protein n=1 Tax=Anguilla anguilla TaxID=7936 RepID=A0A0E9WSF3_ANGAN
MYMQNHQVNHGKNRNPLQEINGQLNAPTFTQHFAEVTRTVTSRFFAAERRTVVFLRYANT